MASDSFQHRWVQTGLTYLTAYIPEGGGFVVGRSSAFAWRVDSAELPSIVHHKVLCTFLYEILSFGFWEWWHLMAFAWNNDVKSNKSLLLFLANIFRNSMLQKPILNYFNSSHECFYVINNIRWYFHLLLYLPMFHFSLAGCHFVILSHCAVLHWVRRNRLHGDIQLHPPYTEVIRSLLQNNGHWPLTLASSKLWKWTAWQMLTKLDNPSATTFVFWKRNTIFQHFSKFHTKITHRDMSPCVQDFNICDKMFSCYSSQSNHANTTLTWLWNVASYFEGIKSVWKQSTKENLYLRQMKQVKALNKGCCIMRNCWYEQSAQTEIHK